MKRVIQLFVHQISLFGIAKVNHASCVRPINPIGTPKPNNAQLVLQDKNGILILKSVKIKYRFQPVLNINSMILKPILVKINLKHQMKLLLYVPLQIPIIILIHCLARNVHNKDHFIMKHRKSVCNHKHKQDLSLNLNANKIKDTILQQKDAKIKLKAAIIKLEEILHLVHLKHPFGILIV